MPLAPAARANEPDTYGLGSRASAMGGAVAADATDFSGNYYNPAALVGARGPSLSIGYIYAWNHLADQRPGQRRRPRPRARRRPGAAGRSSSGSPSRSASGSTCPTPGISQHHGAPAGDAALGALRASARPSSSSPPTWRCARCPGWRWAAASPSSRPPRATFRDLRHGQHPASLRLPAPPRGRRRPLGRALSPGRARASQVPGLRRPGARVPGPDQLDLQLSAHLQGNVDFAGHPGAARSTDLATQTPTPSSRSRP